jgi:hypothetical protein
MSRRRARASVVLGALAVLLTSSDAGAQGLSVEASAGRVVYAPVSPDVGTSHVMGTVRYDTPRGLSIAATAAPPLGTDHHAWGAVGVGGRLLPSGSRTSRMAVGLDFGAHGLLFRDSFVGAAGSGAIISALPFVSVSSGPGTIELGGGWRGQTLSYAGVSERRSVYEARARAIYSAGIRVEADARLVRATEGTYPFLGGTLYHGGTPLQVWVQAGRWLSTELDDVTWGAGVGVSLGNRVTLWANVRQDAPDPLYWNVARRSWGAGITRRFGRAAPARLPAVPAGEVVIRLSAVDVSGKAVSIAGEFNGWQPVPMQRDGHDWVLRLRLAPGVYRYAFRSETGDWFVPASVVGRRDDGMGGHVAVLVVS